MRYPLSLRVFLGHEFFPQKLGMGKKKSIDGTIFQLMVGVDSNNI